jgi:hypothetical protein
VADYYYSYPACFEDAEKGRLHVETRNDQDPLENTFGVIRLHCGSNSNQTVGQFINALKTIIINGLDFRAKKP